MNAQEWAGWIFFGIVALAVLAVFVVGCVVGRLT